MCVYFLYTESDTGCCLVAKSNPEGVQKGGEWVRAQCQKRIYRRREEQNNTSLAQGTRKEGEGETVR
ncbi:hypothetical protein I7I50_09330 [Histoplasma capsulatum G186AR]|uniref:Uncharacterized protein n=1 Tax=Ajellomyces capsulatus TaxID=5037 RepID=A0A8H7YRA5_AJECA|nr:hypothetical protein I7I52_06851 [Histoplasma capsulatum]QSS74239.1 hypothetical protein I7I50_09330 [Histoplasma capsulatum G186AR]